MPEEKNPNWGGARPGAGRPRRSPPHFEPDQWALIAEVLHEHSTLNFSTPENPYAEMAEMIEAWQLEVKKARDRFDEALKDLRADEARKSTPR